MTKLFAVTVLLSLSLFGFVCTKQDEPSVFKINTSNKGKLKEYQRLFSKYQMDLKISEIDLDEVDADPITVIAHKASQLEEGILVEDTSLEVDGADIGVNIRWLLDSLDQFENKKAIWTTLLGYRKGNKIYIFKGEVVGTIVYPQMDGGFGFDPYFLPEGSTKTLAAEKPDHHNARALAVENLVNKNCFQIEEAIFDWNGPWQKHD
ncbi:non-canonical purine NTP pyrophosphatase [Chlamydiales bacterium]|nr:non-canonical purine NTP pyrophosphatase [Chlamydiales bacterium]